MMAPGELEAGTSPSRPSRATQRRPVLASSPTGIVEVLRRAILDGAYAPRERLVEIELCQHLGAPRAAVRLALQQLAFEGLVELQPHKGARVKALSVDEAVEITEARMAIEGLCASLAAARATEEELGILRQIVQDMALAANSGETARYHDLNKVLHYEICRCARNETCLRLLDQFRAQMVRHQFVLALQPGRPRRSLVQHQAIIDAICARRPGAAERAMRAHLDDVVVALRDLPHQLVPGSAPSVI